MDAVKLREMLYKIQDLTKALEKLNVQAEDKDWLSSMTFSWFYLKNEAFSLWLNFWRWIYNSCIICLKSWYDAVDDFSFDKCVVSIHI